MSSKMVTLCITLRIRTVAVLPEKKTVTTFVFGSDTQNRWHFLNALIICFIVLLLWHCRPGMILMMLMMVAPSLSYRNPS